MRWFDNAMNFLYSKEDQQDWAEKAKTAAMSGVNTEASYYGDSYLVYEELWDGEKTQGELGAPISYEPDYSNLSFRSWQAFTESDLAQIIIKARVNWVIGSGLSLQAEPVESIINAEGFSFNKDEFTETTESRFRLFAKTKNSVHSKMMNFNKSQRVAYLNAIVGGDVLIINRVENKLPTTEMVDGLFVMTPNADEIEKAESRENKIIHGVEINKRKQHVAYYVLKDSKDGMLEFTRIEAIGASTGRTQAYLLYGSEYRIDSVRGLPLLSGVLEKMKKLDRYNEAIVGGTEEKAKKPWTVEHKEFSTGEDPTLTKLTGLLSAPDENNIPTTDSTDITTQSKLIKKTFQKEVINLPIGASLKSFDSGMESNQEAFTTGNFIFICAAVEIPYEVALMKFVNSFSSSRMASQMFLTILMIQRTLFNDAYNKPFYNLFLELQIFTGKIKADGYFSAKNKGDIILMEAYRNARFTGSGVPQADPSKEVKALVLMIENNLISREDAIEVIGRGGDFIQTLNKLAKEKQKIIDTMPKEPEEEPKEE